MYTQENLTAKCMVLELYVKISSLMAFMRVLPEIMKSLDSPGILFSKEEEVK